MSRYRRELSVALAYLLLLAVLAVAAPAFYQGDKLRAIFVGAAPILVASIGMTLVILTRHIDISVGSQFSIAGVVAGLLAKAGSPMPLVVGGAIATGAVLGAINGTLIAGLSLPSIVVTLATLVILREGLRWGREGEFVKDLPADFQWFGLSPEVGPWVILALALIVFAVFAWALAYLSWGRAVYATGSDPGAAWLVGIRPRRVVFSVFVLAGALSGLAATLNAVRFIDVDPSAGTGLEMQVIAAVVVGGVAISGGRGSPFGPLLGVALLATIGPALVFLGAQPYWDKALQGTIILLAVASDALELRRRRDANASVAAA